MNRNVATRCGQFAAGQIRALYQLGAIGDRSDRQLLEQFLIGEAGPAELAFEALVERHGPMVLGVCSALLRNPHDAQDAFQATFLVLLRTARVLWIHDSLGPWLHRVAKRVAVRVQVSARRRRAFERRAAESRIALTEPPGRDTRWTILALHEEIDRLPERYRVPVVLCHLEGQSHEVAAKTLRLPVGTVKSRLHRARELLRGRLSRRGVAFSASLLTAEIAASAAKAGISLSLLTASLRASARAGMTRAGECGFSPLTVHLVEEAIKTMFLTRIRIGVAITLLAACLIAGAAGVFAQQGAGPEPRVTTPNKPGTAGPAVAPPGQSPAPAPSYITQSRKMIVERLEQELAVARERLDRTSRIVRSENDPALLRARKTADALASLIARIDDVLVDAVDEFPTMFDFSNVEAESPTGPKAESNKPRTTAIVPHLELSVSEAKREIEIGQTTIFQIRLSNDGAVDVTGIEINARLTDNLEAQNTTALIELPAQIASQKRAVKFDRIETLKPGTEMILGIRVRAVGSSPVLGTCRVAVTYDGSSGALEETAGVKVTPRTPTLPTAAAVGSSADSSAKITAPSLPNFDDASTGLAYDEHSLARAAEILEWSTRMREKGYLSKEQNDRDRQAYETLKSRIEADIARAADRVDWAKRMFEKGYVSKTQYDAEILKHYDALKARKEGPAVNDEILERYNQLKQQIPGHPAEKEKDGGKSGTNALPSSAKNPKDGSQSGKSGTSEKPAAASSPKQ